MNPTVKSALIMFGVVSAALIAHQMFTSPMLMKIKTKGAVATAK